MGQTTEELNTEIAGTRETLASDLDALQDKVSPRAVMQRQKSAVGDRWRSMRSKVMGSGSSATDRVGAGASGVADTAQEQVVGSPIAAGLVAFGAGMVLAGMLPATEKESELSSRAVDAVKEHGQPLMDTAKSAGQDMAQNLKPEAEQAAREVKDTAAGSAQRVTEEGKSATGRVASESS
jgi:ElaB/YqjD/DUF883 family membrane-anchored ribosome-binding protein